MFIYCLFDGLSLSHQMANPVELVALTLFDRLKSTESISDELLLALTNVFPSNMVAEATKLIDEKKIQLLQSESGRKMFKVTQESFLLFF